MGNLMRRYWVPVLLSSEIAEKDGPQVRVKILGERLLAFRDSEGQAGLIDEFCSHRGASLFLGRNEEGGIRCSYHGLKFDRLGNCVDAPCAPQACKVMGIKAWPVVPRDVDFKKGTLAALGLPNRDQTDVARAWQSMLARVRTFRDLDPDFTREVEKLIDFVTQDHLDEID